jgi:hypothetical protein
MPGCVSPDFHSLRYSLKPGFSRKQQRFEMTDGGAFLSTKRTRTPTWWIIGSASTLPWQRVSLARITAVRPPHRLMIIQKERWFPLGDTDLRWRDYPQQP